MCEHAEVASSSEPSAQSQKSSPTHGAGIVVRSPHSNAADDDDDEDNAPMMHSTTRTACIVCKLEVPIH